MNSLLQLQQQPQGWAVGGKPQTSTFRIDSEERTRRGLFQFAGALIGGTYRLDKAAVCSPWGPRGRQSTPSRDRVSFFIGLIVKASGG